MRTTFVILALALALALPGLATAQSTSSSSSSSGSSSSSSVGFDGGNVLGALALGAGGRGDQLDRSDILALYSTPFLPGDPCVASVRVHAGGIEAHRARTDVLQMPLAQALAISNGTLSQDALAATFRGERDRWVVVDCGTAGAVKASDALLHPCIDRNRGCALALVMRLAHDGDGIDENERLRAIAAFER